MLRSAAKNHDGVTVIVDPADYAEVAKQISESAIPRRRCDESWPQKFLCGHSAYDAAIAVHLKKEFASEEANVALFRPALRQCRHCPKASLRRKPHQKAVLYGQFHRYFSQLHGKELSYNNILDLTAAAALIAEFEKDSPTLAILKHTNPCGVGQGASLREAWDKAFCNRQSSAVRWNHRNKQGARC